MSLTTKKIISRRTVDPSLARFQTRLPPVLERIYLARGVCDDQSLQMRLDRLHKPASFKGLDEAVRLLVDAFYQQQRVLIIGDFDADGATSCALSVMALQAMGLNNVDYLVPNRFDYGYGLTPEIVAVAAGRKPDILVTVDNGISSIEGVVAAQERGMMVIVTDHHLPGEELPGADAIVNPNQHHCDFPSKNLAGVGVIFYVMTSLRSALRDKGWFREQGIQEPNMASFLDLVAVGTVADVVPLDFNNRVLVHQGLQRIRAGAARPGILALLEVAGRRHQNLVASDLGFVVGPRLNASGRLDDISLGIQCLLCDSAPLAREMALELDELNRDRKAIESGMQQEALKSLNTLHLDESSDIPWGLCLYDPNWHQGVIGILASRIKDRLHRPVIAFAEADNGEIKGSARSIEGLHIRDALSEVAAQAPDLLRKFGGHAMAAGLSIAREDFTRFQAIFDQVVRNKLTETDLQAQLLSDGCLDEEEMSLALAQQLRDAGPWGQHFPEPLFDGEFCLLQQRIVGEKHLKMVVSCSEQSQIIFDAIAFNVDVAQWPDQSARKVRMAYRLDINEFRGRTNLQLMVDYLEAIDS
ncbi:single-stranded-DNA-specific exonuclease RecJ [Gilvimarinus sp. F26214L]|uniref:single-stranded-DNA-specific exonuclease RecJ n=1 Tax=Gilvimarinus sp. DZF01 TaxID=3461371 RepID=UPI0040458CF6